MIRNRLIVLLALFSSSYAAAGPCSGVTLPGEYQILALDGSNEVVGRIDLSFFGGFANVSTPAAHIRPSAKAADKEAGWNEIVLDASEDPTHVGEDLQKLGRVRLVESLLACRVAVESHTLGTETYRLRMKSTRGDLILADDHDKSVPKLILRKLETRD